MFVCGRVFSEFSDFKIISRKKKDSLLSSTQYELFWSHACFKQHQNLAVRVKCHNHESCFNYNYILDLFVFSGGFGKSQKHILNSSLLVCLRHVCLSASPSVRPSVRPPAQNILAPNGRVVMKYFISGVFKICLGN